MSVSAYSMSTRFSAKPLQPRLSKLGVPSTSGVTRLSLSRAWHQRGSRQLANITVGVATPHVGVGYTNSSSNAAVNMAYHPEKHRPHQAPLVVETSPAVLSPNANFENLVGIGAYKAKQPAAKIFVLGIVAGCYIAFGGLLMLSVAGNMPGLAASNYGLHKLVSALVFPVGLLMVMLGGAELYTGNTFTVGAAYLEGKITLHQLSKSWLCSYMGNFVGSLLMVAAVSYTGILAGNPMPAKMAAYKTSVALGPCIVRAVLANWLVCVAVFHALAASSLPGKLLGLWAPITTFVAIGLEHSVANMFIIPLGMTMGASVSVVEFLLHNLIPVTVGNTISGVLIMALMYSFAYGKLGRHLFRTH